MGWTNTILDRYVNERKQMELTIFKNSERCLQCEGNHLKNKIHRKNSTGKAARVMYGSHHYSELLFSFPVEFPFPTYSFLVLQEKSNQKTSYASEV